MSKIQILPELIINQIAAGEVVERPASVVKELLENAIDAGATQISLTIKNGGKDWISVLDNGCGMSEEDARLAVERHATSKIREASDLASIQTLGFRGEALASIASVSKFELISCENEDEGAIRLQIKGGYLENIGKTAFAQGSRICVERLFFNTPARLKFMKSSTTEYNHIQQNVIQQAIAHPEIQFRLIHNNQIQLKLAATSSLQIRIAQIFGEEFQDGLLAVSHKESYLQYEGLISTPANVRSTRRWQYLFVNSRFVKIPSIRYGIYEGYGNFLGKQHPIYFLNINIDPTEVDVNAHPAKTEIRFRNVQLVHAILADQLSKALTYSAQRRFFGKDQNYKAKESLAPVHPELPFIEVSDDCAQKEISSSPAKKTSEQAIKQKKEILKEDVKPQEAQTQKSKKQEDLPVSTRVSTQEKTHAPLNLMNLEATQPTFMFPRGQIFQKYIITEFKNKLLLIDQHKAHAFIFYENYRQSCQTRTLKPHVLQVPLLLEWTPQDFLILEQHLKSFQYAGFQIEPFGGKTSVIHSVPEFFPAKLCAPVFKKMLEKLCLFGKAQKQEEILREIWNVTAHHAAISDDMTLTLEDMETLLLQLEALEHVGMTEQKREVWVEWSQTEIEVHFRKSIHL